MIGAIIGDIVGSRFERINTKSKNFDLFHRRCRFTDDTVTLLAICHALLNSAPDYKDLGSNTIKSLQDICHKYPNAGYGRFFYKWIFSNSLTPYNSYGNGAAMRVSGCGYAANSIEEAIFFSNCVTKISHNHVEGIKGAESVTVAIYLARTGNSIEYIKNYIVNNYYQINFILDEIRDSYKHDESCQNSVPQALQAFFESTNFEDAVRNAVSIGGDSDTITSITGSIAGAYYGVPTDIRDTALKYLDSYLKEILEQFENRFVNCKP